MKGRRNLTAKNRFEEPPDCTREEWRLIPGFHDYEASTFGRVRRATPGPSTSVGRMLCFSLNQWGYRRVNLRNDSGFLVTKGVHRLVAETFIGEPPLDAEVNHKNGIKADNTLQNLEYLTPQENIKHAIANGLVLRGERSPVSRLSDEKVRQIRRLFSDGVSAIMLSGIYGVTRSTIYCVVRGVSWAHVS